VIASGPDDHHVRLPRSPPKLTPGPDSSAGQSDSLLRSRPQVRILLGALLVGGALVAAAGCGGDDGSEAEAPEPRTETVDPLPKLPGDWKRYVNHREGFAIGLPPGWKAEGRPKATLLRSPDRLVAVSISADRAPEALEISLRDYGPQVVEALRGFKDLKAGKTHFFEHRYQGVRVSATARARESDIRQRLIFIGLRRDRVATYGVLIARNAEQDSGFYGRQAIRMVRTLRGRPVK
jgi:hypothetical protein